MPLDTVPWMVAGGAVHTAEIGRTLAFAATGGKSGVIEPRDLLVRALATPGGAVRVAAGAAAIVNTYAGQAGQSYTARNTADENVSISPTGGTARSDMLVLRIDDPQYGGSTPALGVAVGPYVRFEVIPNVGAGATAVPSSFAAPAIPLSRIDIPAGTATISNAMIVDLRALVRPRTQREVYTRMGAAGVLKLTSVAAEGVPYPDAVGFNIAIPTWATKVTVVAHVSGMIARGPGAAGFKIGIGSPVDADRMYGPETFWDDGVAGNPVRSDTMAAMSVAVPVGARGTTKNLALRGRKLFGTDLEATSSTVIVYDVEFSETPASS